MDKPKIALISLGCDKNLVESEKLLGSLSGGSFDFCPSEEDADVIIINTCGFIKQAEDEAREHIEHAVSLNRVLIVTGCFAQRYGDKLLDEFPGINAIVTDFGKVAEVLSEITGIEIGSQNKKARVLSTPRHYAYLKIAEGCDNACAYCAIPLIKGPYIGRAADDILEEAKVLAEGGVKELIIIAQDTACYENLPGLLRQLSEIGGIIWLRLLYCYPEHITDELISEIAGNPKICKYLDMPIQHSNGGVLKRMGRKTDEAALRALIQKLRTRIPGLVLRTTVMAGFPGETKEEFQSLLKFLADVRFERLGAFAYSREEGTAAYDFEGQLPEKQKTARRNRIMEQQSRVSAENLKQHIGRTLNVLVDGYDGIGGVYFCRSYMDCPEVDGLIYVKAKFGELTPGEFAGVTIKETDEYDMYGVIK